MKTLLLVQSAYYLLTAIWPLVHIKSFMHVTGPKTDIWLVKTVALLLLTIGACYLAASFDNITSAVILLAITVPCALIFVDVNYSLRRIISYIYLADAAIELIIIFFWLYKINT